MKTAVFLIGYLCLGPIDDKKCINIASQYLYLDVPNCEIAKENIMTELDDIDSLILTCVPSDLIENYIKYRPEIILPEIK
tara:strand:+ start:409 stop:648 length:240 start_codon:yes stop_codon:yes gene_type:complete